MAELVFDVVGARPERHAVGPTLVFDLRISEVTGQPVHAVALRCQFRVEPQRRRYSPAEEERLADLFGARQQWAGTLRPMQLATISHLVPAFTGAVDTAVSLPCTYDMEVATGKYFHSLDDGEIPLLVLFSGTVFTTGTNGFGVEQIPWHREAAYRLPVAVWRSMMDAHFPETGWLRLRRDTLDGLRAFATREAIPSWDQVMQRLLEGAQWAAR